MITTHDTMTVAALRRRDEAAFQLLYKAYYPMVERLVVRNSGTTADAADVFQDTLLILVGKLEQENWELTASLKTYLYAVSHKLWLKRLEQSGRMCQLGDDELVELADDVPDDVAQALPERVSSWLGRITAHCQTLIRLLFFEGRKPAEVGYKNAHTAQNQQYKCLQQVRRVADRANE